jgi:HD superfamily phosphodiesterase
LANEPVATPDHEVRMTSWCQKLGRQLGADLEVLTAGALVHDIGVPINRKEHYLVGRDRGAAVLKESGLPEEKIGKAVHVLESHSRYGGPQPETIEAQIGQDSDALEYIGAIGLVRAVVLRLTDGSFNGRIETFPSFLRALLTKVAGTFHASAVGKIGRDRIEFMKSFLKRLEDELRFES